MHDRRFGARDALLRRIEGHELYRELSDRYSPGDVLERLEQHLREEKGRFPGMTEEQFAQLYSEEEREFLELCLDLELMNLVLERQIDDRDGGSRGFR